MNRLIIIGSILLCTHVLTGLLSWQAASGKCAINENKAISKAVDESNKASIEITENATKIDEAENVVIKKIIETKYIPAPVGACPMRNVSQYMRDVYTASAETEIQ